MLVRRENWNEKKATTHGVAGRGCAVLLLCPIRNTQGPSFTFSSSFLFGGIQQVVYRLLYSFRSAEQGNQHNSNNKTSYITKCKIKIFLLLSFCIEILKNKNKNGKIEIGVLLARPSQGPLCSCSLCTIFKNETSYVLKEQKDGKPGSYRSFSF